MKRRCAQLVLALLFAVAACEGPTGPAGPEGPQGDPGPGTRITFLGQLDAEGQAFVRLPSEAGTMNDLPVVSGYIAETANGPWIVVSDGFTDDGTPWMAIGTDSGQLVVVILDGPPGWHYQIAVAY